MTAEDVATLPGVVITPQTRIHDSIKRQVDAAMATLPAGVNGALLAVATERGVNLAVAARIKGDWQVAGWVGKNWDGPVEGGVAVRKTW